jgi:hypothetical protein
MAALRRRRVLLQDHPACQNHARPGKQLEINLALENLEASALCFRLRDGIQRRYPDPLGCSADEILRLKKTLSVLSELYGIGPTDSAVEDVIFNNFNPTFI